MAAINDLLQQIPDKALRERLEQEYARLNKGKKFGLVFEEHIPECTPLYNVAIRSGSTVAFKNGPISDLYTVLSIKGETALCFHKSTGETKEIALVELVAVARFGEPIFPTLTPMDKVENAPDSQIWHTLIEADNYHALQLLEYLYPGQVDCIYIDPPYNTGARDWKYNNDYVDSSDSWRHSKWLSMMQKRLRIARRVLNPNTGVLIVTIDEHEVHHLWMLLAQIFPEAYIQMVTDVVNPKGVTQGRFSRVEEYNLFCFMPQAYVSGGDDPLLGERSSSSKPRWKGLLRSGTNAKRIDRKNMFYPILVDSTNKRVIRTEQAIPYGTAIDVNAKIDGYDVAWPIRSDGSEGNWGVGNTTLNGMIEKGFVALGNYDRKRNTWAISYLSQRPQRQIQNGELRVVGYDIVRNVIDVEYTVAQEKQIKSVWHRSLHDAGVNGSDLVSGIIGQSRAFSFPKSIYSTKDAIAAVMRSKKDAVIVDFFAGSGTTLNAVNLLNTEDAGNRRCILVTNNEVSEVESKGLKKGGFKHGDTEWESHGICRSVTWPRSKYSILGKRDDGTALTGEYFTNQTVDNEEDRSFYQLGFATDATLTFNDKKQIVAILRGKDGKTLLPQNLVKADSKYIVSENHAASILFDAVYTDSWLSALEDQDQITEFYIFVEDVSVFRSIKTRVVDLLGTTTVTKQVRRPMSEGFPTNVEYFRLDFLDKNMISLGRQFKEILPLLWLKAGTVGKRPEIEMEDEPYMLILPENNFAILVDETCYATFAKALDDADGIDMVYFVTNSDEAFHEMSAGIKTKKTYQLYRNYIDNFMIGARRDSK